MFGIRVDHYRVSQLLSVLGSAIVVSVGYGVRSLLNDKWHLVFLFNSDLLFFYGVGTVFGGHQDG